MVGQLSVGSEAYNEFAKKYGEGSLLLIQAVERIDESEGKKHTILNVLANSEENEELSDFEKRVKKGYHNKNEFVKVTLYVYSMRPNNPMANALYPNAELKVRKKFLGLPG